MTAASSGVALGMGGADDPLMQPGVLDKINLKMDGKKVRG